MAHSLSVVAFLLFQTLCVVLGESLGKLESAADSEEARPVSAYT